MSQADEYLVVPDRPQETYTWETRIEPQIMATFLDWIESIGVMPRTKSELLRLAALVAVDLLERNGGLVRIVDLQQARERLAKSGIIDLNNSRTESKRKATAVQQALAQMDGRGFTVSKQYVKPETKPPLFMYPEEVEMQKAMAEARAERIRVERDRPIPDFEETPQLMLLNKDRFRNGLGPITDEQWDTVIAQQLDPLTATIEQIDASLDAESERIREKDRLLAQAERQAVIDMMTKAQEQ